MLNKISIVPFVVLTFLLFSQAVLAENPSQKIENVLSLKQAPAGIVFEIVTSSTNSLEWALPQTKKLIKKLRTRFPNIDITIVTHGNEQFALTKKNNKKFKKVHSLTQQLSKENNVQLHVCGTYAEWNDTSAEDFPDYVDVTAAGPATINDYVALGYILIKL